MLISIYGSTLQWELDKRVAQFLSYFIDDEGAKTWLTLQQLE